MMKYGKKWSKDRIRNNDMFQYQSAKKFIKFFVPGFAFKHDNSLKGKDKFIGRDLLIRRLFLWLSSESRSGSYLITGYRGMGKSLLVNKVLESICRPQRAWKELVFYVSWICVFAASLIFAIRGTEFGMGWGICLGGVSLLCILALTLDRYIHPVSFWFRVNKWNVGHHFDKDLLSKYILRCYDNRDRKVWRIPIKVNLGQEILNERDVLGIIAQIVRDKYTRYAKNRQNRPLTSFVFVSGLSVLSCWITHYCVKHNYGVSWLRGICSFGLERSDYDVLVTIVAAVAIFLLLRMFFMAVRDFLPYLSTPHKSIRRLNRLCERINASVNEDSNISAKAERTILSVSLLNGRRKEYPIANVREIEQELQDIINQINNPDDCPGTYRVQFIIIFDELDKVSPSYSSLISQKKATELSESPEFDASVDGFTGTMGYEARKKDILHLLANMKFFITTVKAKCIFISGHELYDASLADLSDREFAISSIFNGVMNVDSFLSPEREQNEVSSMTEMYLVNMLLPKGYMMERMWDNAHDNDVLKEELPSLRWYNEYLVKNLLEESRGHDNDWLKTKEEEIRFAVEFLRHFAIYLAHICNGSPKKISTYFEKYIRVNYDVEPLYEWDDVLSFGKPTEKNARKQCVLWFDSSAQRLVNFMYYIASPVMKAISNEVSHYGDKLLVTSSFILDQIYKYHGKGFSWRNLEQMPELLNANKNPELRDSMASMVEFLLQTHITQISSGIYQYKFHKQIAEEITYISMMSEEASAIFNFTLNESGTVKRYNLRLLDYYLRLSKVAPKDASYHQVIERLHENLGDIYFMDEDYYCAIHEYRNALKYIENEDLATDNVLGLLKCSLKIGMSYEYRRTYENAYMIYCETINKLVHLRWIDERSIGLDYTSIWTDDWRVKQPMLVDYKSVKDRMEPSTSKHIVKTSQNGRMQKSYQEPSEEEMIFGKNYRKQFLSGVWQELHKDGVCVEYSTTTDNIISGLSSNFTPEKSDILQRLTVFEDVRYIYLAIIAKLFVIEKMEMGGVSYSNIEIAESEFLYLHSTTKIKEKYMISAEFFHKMAEIMYYKNGYVTPLPKVSNLVSSLYFYDCNILGLVDDYCFDEHKQKSASDVHDIKQCIYAFFENLSFENCIKQPEKSLKEKIERCAKGSDSEQYVSRYLAYVKDHLLKRADVMVGKIEHCTRRRENLLKMGYKLPCNACRYAYRSLDALAKYMFVEENSSLDAIKNLPVVLKLMSLTSRKHIRHIRQSELSLMANTAEQMGDIMLSCSITRTNEFDSMSRRQHVDLESFKWEQDFHLQDDISVSAIELLEFLTSSPKSEVVRQDVLKKYANIYFSKIDKALMFYWAASRFYDMASFSKEAAYCMERMLKVIQGYLKVVGASATSREKCMESIRRLYSTKSVLDEQDEEHRFALIRNIFRYATKYVGTEFDNYELGEMHEYRWLFHMERMDDVDLSRLSEFTDLKPILLVCMDIKIRSLEYLRRFETSEVKREHYWSLYRIYIKNVYSRICSPLRHDKTFKEEVLGCFMKAQVNKRVLLDCLGSDIVMAEKVKRYGENPGESSRPDFHEVFYKNLNDYLMHDGEPDKIDRALFSTSDIKSRLGLIEYLVQDSFVCLSSILSVLTPHNHLTTFPHFFLAEVYELMWEWSKYYEMLYDLYLYRKYDDIKDTMTKDAIAATMARGTNTNMRQIGKIMRDCLSCIEEQVDNKDKYGYQYSRLLMGIRHDVDDATIHHIFTNVSVQLSTKYYKMAKDVNNEGPAYKNMITGMYVLDDDLRNDTSQSNLADERYLWHCGLIDRNRDMMARMYEQTSTNKLDSYEYRIRDAVSETGKRLNDRMEDSLYLNSEY